MFGDAYKILLALVHPFLGNPDGLVLVHPHIGQFAKVFEGHLSVLSLVTLSQLVHQRVLQITVVSGEDTLLVLGHRFEVE